MRNKKIEIFLISTDEQETPILEAELEISGYRNRFVIHNNIEEASSVIITNKPKLIILDSTFGKEKILNFYNTFTSTGGIPFLILANKNELVEIDIAEKIYKPLTYTTFINKVKEYVPLSSIIDSDKKSISITDELTKYKDLFDRASDVILLIDFDTHIIIDANIQAEKTYGYTKSELIGKSLLEIIPRYQHISILKNTRVIAKRGVLHTSGERSHYRKNGTLIQVTVSASLIKYGNKLVFQDIVRDETDRIKQEELLKKLNSDLESSNKKLVKKTEQLQEINSGLESFAYYVSHDLKAPLRAISFLTNILVDDNRNKLDKESIEKANLIAKNVIRMGNLIDDLLRFSRMQKIDLKYTSINMKDIVNEVLNDLGELVPLDNKSIIISNLQDAMGDKKLLKLVWNNLISNAIKYTSKIKKGIKIEIQSIVEQEYIKYQITDNGIGFDAKYKEKVFEVFQRLHSENEYEGNGVGLALTKQIILKHGGRIWSESELNHGASFYFTLPKK